MSTLPTFVRGSHRSPVNSPHKGGQWHGSLMFSLICTWTSGCVNNWDDGDLRRHRAHYDITVMQFWRHRSTRRENIYPSYVFSDVLAYLTVRRSGGILWSMMARFADNCIFKLHELYVRAISATKFYNFQSIPVILVQCSNLITCNNVQGLASYWQQCRLRLNIRVCFCHVLIDKCM